MQGIAAELTKKAASKCLFVILEILKTDALNEMKVRPLLFALTLWVACPSGAGAGLLDDTCSSIYKKLGSGPHESLTMSGQDFDDEGRKYAGCVIHLSSTTNQASDDQNPEGLFGLPLPYCPDGKMPADLPRDFLNKDGWCSDRMADGPDGTSYRAVRGNIFCAVEGRWDGGDDSDPGYVPLPGYAITVKCAAR